MTKKDFIVIARTLKMLFDSWEREQPQNNDYAKQTIVGAFVGALYSENSKFDADKFRKAVFGQ